MDVYRQLFSKKLLFVTGKGGVGKSTLVYHLAKQAVHEFDKDVTVYSVGQSGFFEDKLVNKNDRKNLLDGKEVKLFPGATVQVLYTFQSFLEYVHYRIKIPRPLLKLANHHWIRNAFLAVPGLSHTILLGKIWFESTKRARQQSSSLVIVEAPPFGQVEQFLSINQKVKTLFRMGPFFEDAKKVEAALTDPDFCEMVLVTLLDDLPVEETTEYVSVHHKPQLLLRYLVCNRVMFEQELTTSKASKKLLSHPIGGFLYKREKTFLSALNKLPLTLVALGDHTDVAHGRLVSLS